MIFEKREVWGNGIQKELKWEEKANGMERVVGDSKHCFRSFLFGKWRGCY